MRERPIIFSGPMVRAILDGRKTQTRRVVKLRPPYVMSERSDVMPWPWATTWAAGDVDDGYMSCPYGIPGDRLWVRETFYEAGCMACEISQAAGLSANRHTCRTPEGIHYRADDGDSSVGPWTPSIFMPRWASRLTLAVTAVRVERVQEISEEDVLAEGVERIDPRRSDVTLRGDFRRLWDSINGKRGHGWETNPWVWVVEFAAMEGA